MLPTCCTCIVMSCICSTIQGIVAQTTISLAASFSLRTGHAHKTPDHSILYCLALTVYCIVQQDLTISSTSLHHNLQWGAEGSADSSWTVPALVWTAGRLQEVLEGGVWMDNKWAEEQPPKHRMGPGGFGGNHQYPWHPKQVYKCVIMS